MTRKRSDNFIGTYDLNCALDVLELKNMSKVLKIVNKTVRADQYQWEQRWHREHHHPYNLSMRKAWVVYSIHRRKRKGGNVDAYIVYRDI